MHRLQINCYTLPQYGPESSGVGGVHCRSDSFTDAALSNTFRALWLVGSHVKNVPQSREPLRRGMLLRVARRDTALERGKHLVGQVVGNRNLPCCGARMFRAVPGSCRLQATEDV